MKAPSLVGNGENCLSSDNPDRGVMPDELIPGRRPRAVQGGLKCQVCSLGSQRWPSACRDRGQGFGQLRGRDRGPRDRAAPTPDDRHPRRDRSRPAWRCSPGARRFDAITHQVAVALLDDIPKVNADAKIDRDARAEGRRCARACRAALRSRTAPRRPRCEIRRGCHPRCV